MKTLRTFCAACVLAIMLAVPALADDGHIETPIVQPPPPASAPTTTESDMSSVAGHIETGVASTDPATTAALSLLQSALALF